ncbi:MAG: glucosamine-6-phosphate deaminase [Christensenellales bacterium]|jgi:glucosamine-6-phosphate isomerase
MKVNVMKDENAIAFKVAREIETMITAKPDALICLCAGSSPVPIMKRLVQDAKDGIYPSNRFKFVSLDEWVGLGIKDLGSCIHDVSKYFLDPLSIKKGERMFFFDGLSKDLEGECRRCHTFIEKNGGIDVILLGIGMNGHIGFNEPGTQETDGVRVIRLSEMSKAVGVKYFDREYQLKQGITIGIPQILGARRILVICYGAHKKAIAERAVRGDKNTDCPITLIRDHNDIEFYFDEKAAEGLYRGNEHETDYTKRN